MNASHPEVAAARGAAGGARGRARRWLLALFLVLFGPLLLIELTLRLAGPHIAGIAPLLYHPKVVHRYDEARTLPELLEMSTLGFVPGTRLADFVLNSRSLKTHEYSREKPPGTLRVLAMGDSFTIAAGVPFEDGWPERLEVLLEERLATPVEVLNLGVPAVGAEFEQRLWQLEGRKLEADLVVVGFPVGSNFAASVRARRERTWSDRIALASYTWRLARNAIRLSASRSERQPPSESRGRVRIPEGARGVPVREVVPGFHMRYDPDRQHLSPEAFQRLQQGYLRVCSGRGMQSDFEYTAGSLRRFHDEVVSRGTDFLLMICPTELQANPELLRETIAATTLRPPPGEEEVFAPQEFLRAFLGRAGIRYLDLLPAFQAAAPDGPLYGVTDSHWNVRGNHLAAEVLAGHLTTPREDGEPWPWQDLVGGEDH